MRVMVDTGIFLSIFYSEKTSSWSEKMLAQQDKVISTVTIAEVLASAYKKAPTTSTVAKALVEQSIAPENIVPVYSNIAALAGKFKSKYGPDFSLADSIILATAMLTNCERIITTDPEFEKVSEIKIIKP